MGVVQGREGGLDGGSIKLTFKAGHVVASRRLTPRHFWLCLARAASVKSPTKMQKLAAENGWRILTG